MPLPVAHGLVAASIIAASREEFDWRSAWWPMLVGAALAIVPDFDLFLAWGLGYNLRVHGGFTHSVVFAIALGLIGALLTRELDPRGITTYTTAALSHGLLDFATKKDFGGVMLLWPLSSDKFRLGLFNYFEFFVDPGSQSLSSILEGAINVFYYETLIFAPLLITVILWKRWQQRRLR